LLAVAKETCKWLKESPPAIRINLWDMYTGELKIFLVVAVLLAASAGFSQRAPGTKRVRQPIAPDDVLALKEKAEAGDVLAQLALGEKYAAIVQPADALLWYRKAAEKGNIEARYRIGNVLLFGQPALSGQKVAANPTEGVRWTFSAATNLHPRACRNLSHAFHSGLGVDTNIVEAYAWLQLFAEKEPEIGRKELNTLALGMKVEDIQLAQSRAAQLKRGQWPKLSLRKVAEGDRRLQVQGVTFGGRLPLAVINRRTVAEGETAEIVVDGTTLRIKCLEVRETSVLVEIEGEAEPRVLGMK
jgi:hypothetical protein